MGNAILYTLFEPLADKTELPLNYPQFQVLDLSSSNTVMFKNLRVTRNSHSSLHNLIKI